MIRPKTLILYALARNVFLKPKKKVNTRVELATLALLAPRSNQLS